MARKFDWRRAPPAPFPSILGLSGLAVAWVSAAEALGAPLIAGLAIGAVACVAFLVCFGAYLAKLVARPAGLVEELATPVGRGAIPAASMVMMALSAWALLLFGRSDLIAALWMGALCLHVAIMLLTIRALILSGPEGRAPTPAMLLPFCGYLVAPSGGVLLGYDDLAAVILIASLAPFAVIAVWTLPPVLKGALPPPGRPAAAIYLAPFSLVGTGASLFEAWQATFAIFVGGLVVAAILLTRARWLTAAGWSPLWGAFTFPSSAFAALAVIVAGMAGGWLVWLAWAVLALATVIVAAIFVRVMMGWSAAVSPPA